MNPNPLCSGKSTENLYSTFICGHSIPLASESMTSCPLTASESSGLFWVEAVEHAAFSPHHPALSGGLPGSSALLVLTFRPTWINETSCGGTPEFHSSNPSLYTFSPRHVQAEGLKGLRDIFSPISPKTRRGNNGKISVCISCFFSLTKSNLSFLQSAFKFLNVY